MTQYDDAFMTDVVLSADKDLEWLEIISEMMLKIPEVRFWYTSSTRNLRIIVDMDTDYYHMRCPSASHSFCHGWIVRGILERINDWFGDEAPAWKQIEWIGSLGRIIHIRDEAPFELRRIDLYTNQPRS